MEGEYYMEHGSVAHRGEEIHIISDFLTDIFLDFFLLFHIWHIYYDLNM